MKETVKEIIADLNLPKQILDKTSNLLDRICGPSLDEFGQMWADKVRYRRVKNQIKIFSQTAELLENANLEPKEISLKNIVPLIENCSLEEDENLQAKWANLIANLSTSEEQGFENKAIKTLSNLTSVEARILDFIYEKSINSNEVYNRSSLFPDEKIDLITRVEYISFVFNTILQHFDEQPMTVRVAIENLVNLGLLIRADSDVELQAEDKTYYVETSEETKEPHIKVEFDIEAEVINKGAFHLTRFAVYFVKYCKFEKGAKNQSA